MRSSPVPISAAALIALFFADGNVVGHPTILPRVGRIRHHLETYLDTEGPRYLTYDDLVLLDAQLQLDPAGAVARIGGASLLLSALPGFCQTAWLLPDTADARAQLWVVLALRDRIIQEVPASVSPEIYQRLTRVVREAHATLSATTPDRNTT